jgi:hypothetical protein
MPQTRVENGSALSMTSWTPVIVVGLMVIGASAFAKVSIPPAKACQLLAHLPGMRAGPYQHKEELGWTCVTPYYVLRHSSSAAPHNLAYYIYGTAEHVRELQLVLNGRSLDGNG